MDLSVSELAPALTTATHDLAKAVLSHPSAQAIPNDNDPFRNYKSKPPAQITTPDGTQILARHRDRGRLALHPRSLLSVTAPSFDPDALPLEFDTHKNLSTDPSVRDMLATIDNIVLLRTLQDQLTPPAEQPQD